MSASATGTGSISSNHVRSTSPTSFANTTSSNGKSLRPSAIRSIITAPPWANDEPPSPTDTSAPLDRTPSPIRPRPSQSALSTTSTNFTSTSSNATAHPYDRRSDEPLWWAFTRRGRLEGPPPRSNPPKHAWPIIKSKSGQSSTDANTSSGVNEKEKGDNEKQNADVPALFVGRPDLKERLKSAWLPTSPRIRQLRASSGDNGIAEDEGIPERRSEEVVTPTGKRHSWGFHIPMPTPGGASLTLAQAQTPGWDTPWSPKVGPKRSRSIRDNASVQHLGQGSNLGLRNSSAPFASADALEDGSGRKRTKWYYRRKRIRSFVLTNNYVPLLFRVVNITLTTAALAVAISIINKERDYGIRGAIGSSPILVIIFAPLTLVHVMLAIYLEYFGRPLGLWRTSSKLIHTLSETLFVCAWASALSLCFDNFFTSVIGCAPPSATSWYNQLPRIKPDNPSLGRGDGLPGDYICDRQITLICLVFLGLIMYCTNLFISLFRIFEKVKYQPVQMLR